MKLKKYEAYIDRLSFYACALNIDITYSDSIEHDGFYNDATKRITLCEGLDDSSEVATLIHELGHAVDDTFRPSPRSLDRAYQKDFTNTPLTRRQKAMILACERSAWRSGRVIAKRLKIPLGKWFDDEEAESMRIYRRAKVSRKR